MPYFFARDYARITGSNQFIKSRNEIALTASSRPIKTLDLNFIEQTLFRIEIFSGKGESREKKHPTYIKECKLNVYVFINTKIRICSISRMPMYRL